MECGNEEINEMILLFYSINYVEVSYINQT